MRLSSPPHPTYQPVAFQLDRALTRVYWCEVAELVEESGHFWGGA